MFAVWTPSHGSENGIAIGASVNVSTDIPAVPLGETWLASNPRDPNNMIAVSMAFPREGSWASVMYYTMDGGKTWQHARHGANQAEFFLGADPNVTFGADGTAYYSDLEWGGVGPAEFAEEVGSAAASLHVYVYRSSDGGRTWSEPVSLNGEDHSSVAIDGTDGKYAGRVYVVYSSSMSSAQGKSAGGIGLAYSDDGGVTYKQRVFAPPDVDFRKRIRFGPSPADLVIAPDGTLVLPYLYYLEADPQTPGHRERIEQLWAITSADGGRTFSEPHFIGESTFPMEPGSKIAMEFFDYWPRLAIDSSRGPNHARLYMEQENAADNRVRILVRSSNDMGQTWSEPIQVNDDRTRADETTAGISVSQNGVVGVGWYDRRSDPQNRCFREFFTASLDGGVTFLPNVAVQQTPTCPVAPGNWQPNVSQWLEVSHAAYEVELASPGLRFVNGGDTQGIIGLDGGRFRLAWIGSEKGVMQLSFSSVEVLARPLGRDVGDLLELKIDQPTIDVSAHTMTVQADVVNRTRRAMAGPLALVLSEVGSLFEGLRAENSDNGMTGVGALWYLVSSSKTADLGSNERTKPITLRFRFSKIPKDVIGAAPLNVTFHIFEPHSQIQ